MAFPRKEKVYGTELRNIQDVPVGEFLRILIDLPAPESAGFHGGVYSKEVYRLTGHDKGSPPEDEYLVDDIAWGESAFDTDNLGQDGCSRSRWLKRNTIVKVGLWKS